jgi:hypothetical protein
MVTACVWEQPVVQQAVIKHAVSLGLTLSMTTMMSQEELAAVHAECTGYVHYGR